MSHDRIRSVVFDAVGTLIYPTPPVARVYTQVARRHGSSLSENQIASRFAAVFREVEQRIDPSHEGTSERSERQRWVEIVRRVLDDVSDAEGCFEALWRHFAQPDSWGLYADVEPALGVLIESGVGLAIASNFDRRLIDIVAASPVLRVCRPVLVCSEMGYRKPHARFFQSIPSAVGEAGSAILYVGDDWKNDVEAARSAGLRSVHLARDGVVADHAITSLSDLVLHL